MSKLNWTINHDHWEAVTDHGTYEVGDAGADRAWVTVPDRDTIRVSPFDAGKDVAQAFYNWRGTTIQEAARVLLDEWEIHGEVLLCELSCYSPDAYHSSASMDPDIDGEWVKFDDVVESLRAIAEGGE